MVLSSLLFWIKAPYLVWRCPWCLIDDLMGVYLRKQYRNPFRLFFTGKRPSWPLVRSLPHHLIRVFVTHPSCPSLLTSSRLAPLRPALSGPRLRGWMEWWGVLVWCCRRSERERRLPALSDASRSESQEALRSRWMAEERKRRNSGLYGKNTTSREGQWRE